MSGASGWIKVLMRVNPLTYGMDALLLTLFPEPRHALRCPSGLPLRCWLCLQFLCFWQDSSW